MLTEVNLLVLLLVFFLFTQVLIFMAFFVTVFFTVAKSGTIAGLVLFLLSYYTRAVNK